MANLNVLVQAIDHFGSFVQDVLCTYLRIPAVELHTEHLIDKNGN